MKIAELFEVAIDNIKGAGNVPNNQNVDYLGMKVLMKPSVFLRLAKHLDRSQARSVSGLKTHIDTGGTVASPWLMIRIPEGWNQGDYSDPAQVTGHEGRNRMMAIQELEGDEPIETHLFFSGGIRARHITDQWKRQLQQQLISQDGITINGLLWR